jgi:hypothetical protein
MHHFLSAKKEMKCTFLFHPPAAAKFTLATFMHMMQLISFCGAPEPVQLKEKVNTTISLLSSMALRF